MRLSSAGTIFQLSPLLERGKQDRESRSFKICFNLFVCHNDAHTMPVMDVAGRADVLEAHLGASPAASWTGRERHNRQRDTTSREHNQKGQRMTRKRVSAESIMCRLASPNENAVCVVSSANPNLIQILNAAILHLTSDDVKVVKNYFQTDGRAKREEIKMKNYFLPLKQPRSTINELSSHTLYTLPIIQIRRHPLDTAISRDWHNRPASK